MNYKGIYSGSKIYSVGDVVVLDGVAFYMFKKAAAGTKPHDTNYWARLPQPMGDVVVMLSSIIADIYGGISTAQSIGSSAQKMIAPTYTKKTYTKGEHVTYQSKLYAAKANINPADNSWTVAHWDEVTVGAEILALQTDVAALGE